MEAYLETLLYMLYDMESWVLLTENHKSHIQSAEIKFLRSVKDDAPPAVARFRNDVIRQKLNIYDHVNDINEEHKIKWKEQLGIMDKSRLPKLAHNYKAKGRKRRSVGRPRKRR